MKQAAAKGAETATSLQDLAGKLKPPRAAWLMLPAGHVTDAAVEALAGLFSKGDVIVDGGNSNYKEWMVLAAKVDKTGVGLVDAGTSAASGASPRAIASWWGAPRRPWPSSSPPC